MKTAVRLGFKLEPYPSIVLTTFDVSICTPLEAASKLEKRPWSLSIPRSGDELMLRIKEGSAETLLDGAECCSVSDVTQ